MTLDDESVRGGEDWVVWDTKEPLESEISNEWGYNTNDLDGEQNHHNDRIPTREQVIEEIYEELKRDRDLYLASLSDYQKNQVNINIDEELRIEALRE